MMRVFYDTEFLERGPHHPISLISIGMVREDGAELYRVNAAAPWAEIEAHPWLRDNVLPHLPRDEEHTEEWRPDYSRRDIVESPKNIANAVADFCYHSYGQSRDGVQLWADYGAYDHVVLAQLFGSMIDLPDHMPMWTHDFRQLLGMLYGGEWEPPAQDAALTHDALADARWLRDSFELVQRALVGSQVGKLITL